ncbi:MAG: DNA translocase FtsK [Candidatus Margulisiibacteriota bacterium]
MARKKSNTTTDDEKPGWEFSHFKQDIGGILLIALGIFIFISNLSSSTGIVGLYLVKTFFRAVMGIGVYLLPFFVASYGVIMLLRHEVRELAIRLVGLLVLFLDFITFAQFYSSSYFAPVEQYYFLQGAGGLIGYGFRFSLERVLGPVGSYIILSAVCFIGLLLVSNLTFRGLLSFLASFLFPQAVERKERKIRLRKTPAEIEGEDEGEDDTRPVEEKKSEVERKPVVSFPLPQHMEEEKTDAEDVEEEESTTIVVEDIDATRSHQSYADYKLPPLNLLEDRTKQEIKKAAKMQETTDLRKKLLEEVLASFGVGARVVSVNQGPAVTRFELQPDPGVKVSKIANLADDIALNLASGGVRIEAPVPGKAVIGIEVPNTTITTVRLKDIIKQNEFKNNSSKRFIALGKDLSGSPIYGDLAKMPHLLIAGTTGSGKSVCINSLIMSILYRAKPDEVKFIMIDPKMVELTLYDGIPHLLAPVVTEPRSAALTLKEWVMREMERRYQIFYKVGVRNLASYNKRVEPQEKMPQLVVIVDELADLMMIAAAEVETTICRLAQMARATGIHLVIATQRPSVDVITGLIKANIPSRIAFAVATQIDSRVIIDSSGAEKLLGRGDMLYNPVGAMKATRLQGCFVTDPEAERVIKFIKKQAAPEYEERIAEVQTLSSLETDSKEEKAKDGRDDLFNQAVKLIMESQIASTSYLQRKMRIGYNRAARLMDEIEAEGLVSKPEGDNKARRITASFEALKNLGID